MTNKTPNASFIEKDPYLQPYANAIQQRTDHVNYVENKLTGGNISLNQFASAHEYYGLHKENATWVFREWAPNATSIKLVGDFTNWEHRDDFALTRLNENGDWENTKMLHSTSNPIGQRKTYLSYYYTCIFIT